MKTISLRTIGFLARGMVAGLVTERDTCLRPTSDEDWPPRDPPPSPNFLIAIVINNYDRYLKRLQRAPIGGRSGPLCSFRSKERATYKMLIHKHKGTSLDTIRKSFDAFKDIILVHYLLFVRSLE